MELDQEFARRREQYARQPTSTKDQLYWLKTAKATMTEMDDLCDFVSPAGNRQMKFLDLG